MGIGNAWSNAGLVSQGIDAATERKNAIALQEQNIAQQQQVTAGGNLTLAEQQREAQEAQSMRSATMQNTDSSEFDRAMALSHQAYQSGNNDLGGKYADTAKGIPMQARDVMMNSAVMGLPPEQIEQQIFRLMGNKGIVPGSLKYSRDPTTGHTMVMMKDAKSGTDLDPIDATRYVSMQTKPVMVGKDTMVIDPRTKEVLSQNSSVNVNPRTNQITRETGTNAGEVLQPGEYTLTGKDENGNQTETRYQGSNKIASTGGGGGGGKGGISSKQQARLKEVSDAIQKHERMSVPDPSGSGRATTTDEGFARAALGSKLAMARKDLSTQTIAEISVNGTPITTSQGEHYVLFNNEKYFYQDAGGQPIQQTPQAAPPQTQAQAAPNTAPVVAPPPQSSLAGLALQNTAPPSTPAGLAQAQTDQAKIQATRQNQVANQAEGQRLATQFRLAIKSGRIPDKGITNDALKAEQVSPGTLSQMEKRQAAEIMSQKNYARGGKVCAQGMM